MSISDDYRDYCAKLEKEQPKRNTLADCGNHRFALYHWRADASYITGCMLERGAFQYQIKQVKFTLEDIAP